MSAIIVHPDRRHLRTAIRHQRREMSKCHFGKKLFVRLRIVAMIHLLLKEIIGQFDRLMDEQIRLCGH